MTEPTERPTGEIPMRGHSGVSEGLVAYAQPRPDGTFGTDTKGRPQVRRVQLRREETQDPLHRPEGLLTDAQWKWATATYRRWATIAQKFGAQALPIATSLARSGCVHLNHTYRNGTIQQPPLGWAPAPELAQEHSTSREVRHQGRTELRHRARILAAELAADWPGVSAALIDPAHDARRTWLIRAATDLAEGRVHDSVRAFVQVHAGDTKAREDVTRLLTDSGFEPAAVAQLGISRSPYIGLGGPIRAHRPGHLMDYTGFPGPHDIRLPPNDTITIDLSTPGNQLLVIENRQAAEAICDHYPDLPIIWCHGQPPQAVLTLINQAALHVQQVIICPDADLGGIRIAARIHDHLPPNTRRMVIDVGTSEHVVGKRFSSHATAQIARLSKRKDDIGEFAQACRDRGYGVEQEAPARAALRDWLVESVM